MDRLNFFRSIHIGESVSLDNTVGLFDHIIAAHEYLKDNDQININAIICDPSDSSIIFNLSNNIINNSSNCCKHIYGKTFNINSITIPDNGISIQIKQI